MHFGGKTEKYLLEGNERNLGVGDDAPRAGDGLSLSET
jgi:hypothetical protein